MTRRFISGSLLALVALTLLLPATARGQDSPVLVLYQSPMDTWVEDPFRPPAHIGASGNRGLMYAASEGQAVRAAAPGRVAFAGQVGVRIVITVEHDDGIRTTYTGLSRIQVGRGDQVLARQVMGVAIARFHFGARIRDHYLDPQVLLDASETQMRARLVPPGGAIEE